jgi:DNA polymerase V
METPDTLNDRYGRNTVSIASGGVAGDRRRFSMKCERKTPEYTTRREDMPVARA